MCSLIDASGTRNIRPFAIGRDLGQLADLIQVSFGPELRRTHSHMVHDMRQMALFGGMLGVVGVVMPMITGYVWEVDGLVVGNATVSREARSNWWQLSNVAVLPSHRGQGIASLLVDRALQYVRDHGGQRVFLQVRQGNDVAIDLYRRRGFRTYDVTCEMGLLPTSWPLPVAKPAAVRRMRPRDSRAVQQLHRRTMTSERLRVRPAQDGAYRKSLLQHVSELLAKESGALSRWDCVWDDRRGLAAHGALKAVHARAPMSLNLAVDEARESTIAADVAGNLLARAYSVRGIVKASLSASQPRSVQALQGLGFEEWRVLDEMALLF